MFSKIWAITWRELYTTFTDRNLILMMILTPLALATIIGVAFSGFLNGNNDVPVQDIPMAIVNLDQGAETNGTTINDGDTIVNIFLPQIPRSNDPIDKLTNAVLIDDPDAARAAVDKGTYAAALIIPADFSQKLTYSQTHSIEPVSVEVYGSPANAISASIVRSITDSIVNQIATGSITIEATVQSLIDLARSNPALGLRLLTAGDTFQQGFSKAFDPASNPVSIRQQTVTGQAATFNPLVTFGSAQAVFFMMFTAMGGAASLLEERRDWTLQRLLVSPTPRIVILLGKLFGTFVTCVVQVTILIIALTLVGSLLAGKLEFIWGSNLPLIALTVLAVALAAAGLGSLVASLVRTPEQGNVIGGVVSMAMAVFGGAFFGTAVFPEAMRPLTQLSLVYWGTDAFTQLSQNQTDIGVNLTALLVMGVVMFVAGLAIFNRRLDV